MKTQRRHELATNVLADWLGEKIEALKPYSAAVSVTTLLVVVVIFASVMLYQKREASSAQAWAEYFAAIENQSPDEATDKLEAVAIDHPRSPAGLWSRLSLADTHLASGVEDLFKDRASARKALDRAIDDYQAVVEQAPRDSLLAERATFGLAEAYESKNELEDARKQYHTLLERWPNGAFSALAKDRLADLDRKATKDFYDWFAKQAPQTKPKAGLPGQKPAFDLDKLPDDHFESGFNVGGKKVGGSVKTPVGTEPVENRDAKSPGIGADETRAQGDKETRSKEE
jgi:tetratricopeptide (TPR) repeat protein